MTQRRREGAVTFAGGFLQSGLEINRPVEILAAL
jgi:hypothetical protein